MTVDLYQKNTDNLLFTRQLPWTSGFNSISNENVGSLENKGIDISLNTVSTKGSFRWTTDFNITFNRNVIKSLTAEADLTGKGMLHTVQGTGALVQISRKGQLRKEWYIADWAGVDRLTGVPMIYARDQEQYKKTGETLRLKNVKGTDSLTYATNGNIEANRFYQEGKSPDPKFY
ncbi:MAG: TonB-dependent receptor, partial [Saprospiraceae bacterium]|nr:TonB-dependent receptor [Saprospiraceae bacterium]